MQNPLRTEAEAFRFLVVVIGGAVVIVVAAYINTWVGVAAAVIVIGAVLAWLMRGPPATEPAPKLVSSTPEGTYRLLVVAPPGTSGIAGRVGEAATEVLVVVPALASTVEALTGAVDDRRADAEATAQALAGELSRNGVQARGVVGADDSVQAADDALRTFGADEIALVDGDESLLEQARARFAVPVSRI
ncbi:MAG: hypothetical protein QOF75_632 [Gaiellaceae bacterium]|jgi:hypothetical protein|nr:hypothetical protein [Gaiellaceae bacterium]MDX6472133.1 hypothetical protein [Gaiellaceae bacterium]